MKLKALKPRLHNAMFHTHTVSGIVISFALFVCFYAGAVALFMDELYQWENPNARIEIVNPASVDYDRVLEAVEANVPNFDPASQFGMTPPTLENPLVRFYGNTKKDKEDPEAKTERFSASVNPTTYAIDWGREPKTHMAQTLYHLHYFGQIPMVGIYLSGLVAFFFLFAIFTGVLTHWKNIVSKFYAFTTKGKWKQIWTNGHISLGLLALPFQLIYAVTGSLLGLSILLLLPSAFLMFDGDTTEVLKAVSPAAAHTYDKDAAPIENGIAFNDAYNQSMATHPDTKITYMYSRNFGKEDGTLTTVLNDGQSIGGDGTLVFSLKDGTLVDAIEPNNKSYTEGTFGILIKLHYATFGGIFMKIVYFILAMITCYIIISGMMIWRTARDNKKYSDKQRRFHHRVTKVYLAICLSMFPALALIFIGNKVVPMDWPDRVFYVDSIFFLGWLVLSLTGLFWNNYRKLNRNYILIGSALGLLIPVVNGMVTGDWLWKTLANGQYYVFSVDFTWMVIGIFGLVISLVSLRKKEKIKENHTAQLSREEITKPPVLVEEPAPVLQDFSSTAKG
ncbi:MAG: PepSY-associated TM helix domain-containing protein [Bacteroidota bacterium]